MPRFIERVLLRAYPRAAAHLELPSFLGIGAQKSGTTWLAENLRRHPEIFIPERKELHWFDARWNDSLWAYSRIFANASERVRGEITPAYGVLPSERIRFIRSVMPDLRLILILRNPIERDWSHALMDLAARRRRRAEEVSASEVIAHLDQHYVTQRGDYLSILDRWLDEFPEDQLFVGFFEDIRDDPQTLLETIFTHLGVTSEVDWNAFPIHERISPAVDGRGPPASLEMKGASRPIAERVPPPDAVLAWLRERHEESLRRLAERLGKPATRWLASLAD